MSRSLLMVVWKITVDSCRSSGMRAPLRMLGPGAPSTSCTDDTANTLLGTTRAVTALGMSWAYSGLRLMCT
ncbi:hypothetical protein PICSAR72_04440 [Mycobacterium avium subsp. paratuberculosis]|nr:hypothetical protein PICSAR111_04452 [Mycobacterium avium subsp. paratuberculosis]CAG7107709.1 hypothetical protein PICSAR189_04442 [Mycobacterium avium subsp. paratuberculosis]CAG7210171.1 hypothetical protein PICSAR235_04561 [Mycobacterium avium subsp. paratuberculosis]CAG7265224.1 hypothetical protein PICSAR28_04453 [Mycobacterium avium subsp. paratuberculosis]CAG7302395.1 hypothetical protein PICSAR48_04436 [Mycobacterium avium subsp. paratuberculosis]